jgi:anti-sigma factor RsiW
MSALIDGELSHAQRERVLGHLTRCEQCRREAAALRALKQRMHALGEATAGTALTDRLVALGARYPGEAGLGMSRRRRPVRSIALAALAVAGLGLPAAAFVAGGGQQEPGPSISPAVDTFVMQHEISTGDAEVSPAPSPSMSVVSSPAEFRHRFAPQPAMAR